MLSQEIMGVGVAEGTMVEEGGVATGVGVGVVIEVVMGAADTGVEEEATEGEEVEGEGGFLAEVCGFRS